MTIDNNTVVRVVDVSFFSQLNLCCHSVNARVLFSTTATLSTVISLMFWDTANI